VLPDPPLEPTRPGEPQVIDTPEPPDPAEPWNEPDPPEPERLGPARRVGQSMDMRSAARQNSAATDWPRHPN